MSTRYLDWALADFSGYIAVDELYDGPFCVLSIVDNRAFKRLLYQVLDHDPDHQDITAFLRRFQMALRLHGLKLKGVTTDASPLYPEPLRAVFGDVPHPICEFHIIKELTQAILRAVAKVRKTLAARMPTAKRGRPGTAEAKRTARKRQRLKNKIGDLFEHRHLFVQHDLTPADVARCKRSRVACRSYARSAKSWKKCIACLIAAAARTPRWRSSPNCASASAASNTSAKSCNRSRLSPRYGL